MPSLLPPDPLESRGPAGAHSWHWYAPRVAIGLFVTALLGLLWLLHRQDVEENRASLIRDILWVEQNVRFSLDRDLEQLAQLGQEISEPGLGVRQFELRAQHLLSNGPGLLRIVLLDERGALRASAPVSGTSSAGGKLWVRQGGEPAYRLACGSGRSTYAPAYASFGDTEFEVFVPYYRAGRLAGTVVGIYGIKSILAGLVPWWLAEKHRVTIRDAGGNGPSFHGPEVPVHTPERPRWGQRPPIPVGGKWRAPGAYCARR